MYFAVGGIGWVELISNSIVGLRWSPGLTTHDFGVTVAGKLKTLPC